MAETVAAVFGALYLLVGLLGFVLNPGGGLLLGIFAVNWFHHTFHLVVGGLGLLAAWRGWGRRYCQMVGVVFLVLAALGFAAPGLAAFLLAQPNAPVLTDNLLHLISGVGFVYFGCLPGDVAQRAATREQP
ncbi:MAG: DUF4383 domain-containing protein [Anaerolineales bacterium]